MKLSRRALFSLPLLPVAGLATQPAIAASEPTMPIGVIVEFVGSTPPPGWMICDGRSLSKTDYAALFAKIGVLWGGTATTFNLPAISPPVAGMSVDTATMQPVMIALRIIKVR